MTNDKLVETNTVEAEFEYRHGFRISWMRADNEFEAEFNALSHNGTGRIRVRKVHAYSYDLTDGSHLSTSHTQPWEYLNVKPSGATETTIGEFQQRHGQQKPVTKAETPIGTFRRVHGVPEATGRGNIIEEALKDAEDEIEVGREYLYTRKRARTSPLPDKTVVILERIESYNNEEVYRVRAAQGTILAWADELVPA